MRAAMSCTTGTIAISVALSALCATGANAQAGAPTSAVTEAEDADARPQSGQLDEIVVTARKVQENLQDVPISISVISAEQLTREGATRVADTTQFTPNARMRPLSTDSTSPQISFRGQVQGDNLSTLDPSVGIYVDGVYWARAYGANSDLLDVRRVEVLKGPTGTLFGRNTTGGAIVMTTNDPDLTEMSGSLSAGYGNYDQADFTAIANIPLETDQLALRVAVARHSSNGYGKELTSGRNLFGFSSWTGRAKLLMQPTDRFSLLVSAEYFDFHGHTPASKIVYGLNTSNGGRVVTNVSGGTDALTNYVGGDPYEYALSFLPTNDTTTQTYSAKATYEFDGVTAIATLARRAVDSVRTHDVDGTPYPIVNTPLFASGKQTTGELQLSGNSFSDRLSWTVGGYWFDESMTDGTSSTVLRTVSANFDQRTRGEVQNSALAAYGQVTYKVTDAFNVTAGLRYSVDRRKLQSYNFVLNAAGAVTCTVPAALRIAPGVCQANFSRKDNGLSYTLSAQYDVAQDAMVYVRTSRGFRAGGFNLRGSGTVESFAPFRPEQVTDYEIGFKSELFDRRVRLNGAVFYSNYKDIQRNAVVLTGTGSVASLVNNAAKAHIWGGELEASIIPTEGLRLRGSLGVTLPTYDSFIDFTGDRSGETFEYVSKYTGSLGADYTLPTSFGSANFSVDYSYTSKQNAPKNALPPFTEARAYGLVNGRIGIKLDNSNIDIALYGRNLFNKLYVVQIQDLLSLGFVTNQYGAPRQYGAQITFNF